MQQFKLQSGFVTVYLVVIMGSIFLTMNLVATEYSLNSASLSRHSYHLERLHYLLDGCVELALLDVYNQVDTPYDGNYIIGDVGECQYKLTGDSNRYLISVTGNSSILNIEKNREVIASVENSFLEIQSYR